MQQMNVKQIVTEYLRKHKCDGLMKPGTTCGCYLNDKIMIFCNFARERECVPAIKRRRTIYGKRRTVLVPVSEVRK